MTSTKTTRRPSALIDRARILQVRTLTRLLGRLLAVGTLRTGRGALPHAGP